MTTTFTSVDAAKSISITSATALDMSLPVMQQLIIALAGFASAAPLASVSATGTTATITLADARTVTYTINFGANPPATTTFQMVSPSYWTNAEFLLIQSLAQVIDTLQLADGMTAMTITY
jgi:hypothetical protein